MMLSIHFFEDDNEGENLEFDLVPVHLYCQLILKKRFLSCRGNGDVTVYVFILCLVIISQPLLQLVKNEPPNIGTKN